MLRAFTDGPEQYFFGAFVHQEAQNKVGHV